MELFRIHAYEVTPQRLADAETPPRGGAFSADAEFSKALDDYLKKSKLQEQSTVDLRRAPTSNSDGGATHELRRQVLSYCFGAPPSAKGAALAMARRLGQAMDERSVFTLLILAAYKDDPVRRLVMWAFPKDEPFHFSVRGDRAKIKILKDAFSRSSSFKKAALFEGTTAANAFWSGKVIDKQADSAYGTAADYWVNRFLDSLPSLSGKAGTRQLAKCLRRTHDALSNQSDKDQVTNAIVAVRASRRRQWSLSSFANEYLTDNAKQVFVHLAPPEVRSASFAFSKEEFDERIQFRVFRLEDNVMVTAPFGTVGKSVKIKDGEQRSLKCEGIIAEEKVRA